VKASFVFPGLGPGLFRFRPMNEWILLFHSFLVMFVPGRLDNKPEFDSTFVYTGIIRTSASKTSPVTLISQQGYPNNFCIPRQAQ
jgi:hypothetical protein